MRTIAEADFIAILKDGVQRTSDFMALLTDFHGGPTKTEYILTVDIARAFLDRRCEVQVECPSRRLVNNMTMRKDCPSRKPFWSKLTDVAVTDSGLIPLAMVEVKIRVGATLTPIKGDLTKIAKTLQCMKAKLAENVRSASVFQIHVPGKAKDIETNRLRAKTCEIEGKLERDLAMFGKDWPDFSFKLVPLQAADTGFAGTEVYNDEDGNLCLGENGHVTRYYAILITSLRQSNAPTPFDDLKKGN